MNARRIRLSSRPASLFRPGPDLVAGVLTALGALAAMILLSGPLPAENPPGLPDPEAPSAFPLSPAPFEALAASQGHSQPRIQASAAPAVPAPSQPLYFRNQIIIDQQGFGYEVFRMLVPKDWSFQGGVTWDFNKIPPDAQTAYAISSPDGLCAFEKPAPMTFMWSQDQTMNYTYAQQGTPIMQPIGPAEFLQNFYLPRARSGVSDLKVVETQPLPGLAQYILAVGNAQLNVFHQISPPKSPIETRADSARVKVEYTYNGRRMTEDFTCSISYIIAYTPTMYGQVALITWVPQVESFRAPSEEMASKVRLFQIMIFSRAENPLWGVNYTRLAAVITREQLRQQQAIFARLQQIRQTMNEVDDIITQTYQNRSAAQDRMFEKYTQAYRGVDTYIDPGSNRAVELPSGYGNVWTNGSEYILSDSPGYNPNVGSNVVWQEMNRKR